MASFARGDGVLKVAGSISSEDLDELVEHGRWLLEADRETVTLDLDSVTPEDSSFIGAVAELGAEAAARSKRLEVRAQGRAADMLSWAGLHRVVTLHISSVPMAAT